MNKRVFVLPAVVAALAVPAIAWADDGGSSAPTGAKVGRISSAIERISQRVDKRFRAFSSRCLVANAPERCSLGADRFVNRLDRLQGALTRLEGKIKEKCGAAGAPPQCSSSDQLIRRIDDLLGTIRSDEAAIKAKYPSAGSGSASSSSSSSS